MNTIVALIVFVVGVLVIETFAAPPSDYRAALVDEKSFPQNDVLARKSNVFAHGHGFVKPVGEQEKGPVKIIFYKQSQGPTESEFHYVGDDGNSRQEKITLEKVTNGSKEAVVPRAVGEYNYTTNDGTKIYQQYSSGAEGNIFSIIWNGQEKK